MEERCITGLNRVGFIMSEKRFKTSLIWVASVENNQYFNRLQKNRIWHQLNDAEQSFSTSYVERSKIKAG